MIHGTTGQVQTLAKKDGEGTRERFLPRVSDGWGPRVGDTECENDGGRPGFWLIIEYIFFVQFNTSCDVTGGESREHENGFKSCNSNSHTLLC